jgi:hypothetical protein
VRDSRGTTECAVRENKFVVTSDAAGLETAGRRLWFPGNRLLELVNGLKFDDFKLFAAGRRRYFHFIADLAIQKRLANR